MWSDRGKSRTVMICLQVYASISFISLCCIVYVHTSSIDTKPAGNIFDFCKQYSDPY